MKMSYRIGENRAVTGEASNAEPVGSIAWLGDAVNLQPHSAGRVPGGGERAEKQPG